MLGLVDRPQFDEDVRNDRVDDEPHALVTPELDLLVERIESPGRRFPIRKSLAASIVFHILLLLFVILKSIAPFESEDAVFQEGLRHQYQPVVFPTKFFVESPGPARKTAKPDAAPSDANRQAAGGDRNRPKSETPYIPRQSGMEGLRPGPRTREKAGPAGAPAPPAAPPSPAGPASPPSTSTPAPSAAVPPPAGASSSASVPDLNRAISEAVGGVRAGEGGALPANEEGGYVDAGDVSFDTKWYDWGDYAEEMLRKIRIHWYEHIPSLAQMGPDGELTIRFYIRANGTIEGEKVLQTSGIPPYDHAAFLGISDAAPFRKLPAELHEDQEGVTIRFLYLHYRHEKPARPEKQR